MMLSSVCFYVFAVTAAIIEPAHTAPDPLITPKPRALTEAHLQRRQDDSGPNVYGYIDGDVSECASRSDVLLPFTY